MKITHYTVSVTNLICVLVLIQLQGKCSRELKYFASMYTCTLTTHYPVRAMLCYSYCKSNMVKLPCLISPVIVTHIINLLIANICKQTQPQNNQRYSESRLTNISLPL